MAEIPEELILMMKQKWRDMNRSTESTDHEQQQSEPKRAKEYSPAYWYVDLHHKCLSSKGAVLPHCIQACDPNS